MEYPQLHNKKKTGIKTQLVIGFCLYLDPKKSDMNPKEEQTINTGITSNAYIDYDNIMLFKNVITCFRNSLH